MTPTDEQLFAITEEMVLDSDFKIAARAAYERAASARGFTTALTATASELVRIKIFVESCSPEVVEPLRIITVGILCKVDPCPPMTPFIPDQSST